MSLTWGAVTTDGADVFGERQDCAWGLGGHLHHTIEAQRGLDVLRAADWVHWRVQLEHQHTQNTHTDMSQNSSSGLETFDIIHPTAQAPSRSLAAAA